MLPLLLALPSLALASDARWFHPDESDAIEVVDENGHLYGLPFGTTGEVVVKTSEPGSLLRHPEVSGVRSTRLPEVHLVELVSGSDDFELSRQLRDYDGVSWAHPDLILPMRPASISSDSYVDDQWHLENTGQWGGLVDADINVAQAWEYVTGEGLMVAVIDSGVDTEHPDLDVINGRDYVSDDDDSNPEPEDGSGPHGTAAAGLSAAMGDNELGVTGVARGSTVYGIRLITGIEGEGASTSDVGSAFAEAADAGASVVNNSWGYADCPSSVLPSVIRTGLDYAENQGREGLGTVMVFSAGNDACDNSTEMLLSHRTIIGVGATDDHDKHISYSSYGDSTDIAAPSGAVLTTDISGDDGYGSWQGDVDYTGGFSGTSASAPIVSGAVLLILEANPRLTASQVREVLCATAEPVDVEGGEWDEDGRSKWFGCGRLNVGSAVASVFQLGAPEVPVPWQLAGETTPDRVLLGWNAALDPDGDRVSYEVDWTLDGTFEAEELGEEDTGEPWAPTVTTVQTDETWVDLTDELSAGDTVTWRVRALDDWGPSEDSEIASLGIRGTGSSLILAHYDSGAGGGGRGCASAGAARAGGAVFFALIGLLGLRRRDLMR